MSNTKKLAVCSILLAGVVLTLYLASAFPVMSLTLAAIASIITYVSLVECGVVYSAILFVAAGAMGFLVIPDKSCVIMYTFLFGAYPFIKHFSEKVKYKVISWSVKILCVNALLFFLYFAFRTVLLGFVPGDFILIFAYLIFNFVFIVFDICITRLTAFYVWRIHRHIV
ncbi:MAG: hypothetical protein IKU84_05545 [Clostridia bacterium]|nr:hypothetical protein [Clostridia bacterium]